MIYDLEHYESFKNNCEKDKDGNILRETYLPKTLKYCIENNIKVLPCVKNYHVKIYLPCYLFVVRYVNYTNLIIKDDNHIDENTEK